MNPYNANVVDYSQFDRAVVNQLIGINGEIVEEEAKNEVDNEKITKLRMLQLMKGMEMMFPSF